MSAAQSGQPGQPTGYGATGATADASATAITDVTDGPPKPIEPRNKPFLTVLGGMLGVPSARVQMEVCLALEPLAKEHRVPMCQAQIVSALIALTHTSDDELITAASRVLKLLA